MRLNAKINIGTSTMHVMELNWGEDVSRDISQPDLILAADCVYFEVSHATAGRIHIMDSELIVSACFPPFGEDAV